MSDNKKYLFVFLNKNTSLAGWWLKISSQEELTDYLEKTNSKYGKAFTNYLRDSKYDEHNIGNGPFPSQANLTDVAYYKAINENCSVIDSLARLAMQTADSMLSALQQHGAIYINANGGWNFGIGNQVESDFIRSEKLVWPNFTEKDIRISQFPGGQHYYAYIGPVQVSYKNLHKFDSRSDARQAALAYITQN